MRVGAWGEGRALEVLGETLSAMKGMDLGSGLLRSDVLLKLCRAQAPTPNTQTLKPETRNTDVLLKLCRAQAPTPDLEPRTPKPTLNPCRPMASSRPPGSTRSTPCDRGLGFRV